MRVVLFAGPGACLPALQWPAAHRLGQATQNQNHPAAVRPHRQVCTHMPEVSEPVNATRTCNTDGSGSEAEQYWSCSTTLAQERFPLSAGGGPQVIKTCECYAALMPRQSFALLCCSGRRVVLALQQSHHADAVKGTGAPTHRGDTSYLQGCSPMAFMPWVVEAIVETRMSN